MLRVLTLVLLALPCADASVRAQTLRGRVQEEGTPRPIAAAEVTVLSRRDAVLARAVADSTGGFLLRWTGEDSVRLRATRIGFTESLTATLTVRAGETVTAVLNLAVNALPLMPLTIVARSEMGGTASDRASYERRRVSGVGKFVSRDQIVQSRASQISDVLRQVPGVALRESGNNGSEVEAWSNAGLLSSNPQRPGISNQNINRMATGGSSQGPCPMQIFLDGRMLRNSTTGVNVMPAQHVEAIEVFRGPSEVPTEFSGQHARCGVIAVWSRRQ